ncbi:hypothetical protein PPGU19_093090 (plasmid) [Paraburkholderia sp. PGU19]|nr:hypothetical protein PPGU19_093090 [Paraburkholderia sp. PGU19]
MMESGDADREEPLTERKTWLHDSFDDTETLVYASGVVGLGVLVFQEVRKYGVEGMVPVGSQGRPSGFEILNHGLWRADDERGFIYYAFECSHAFSPIL